MFFNAWKTSTNLFNIFKSVLSLLSFYHLVQGWCNVLLCSGMCVMSVHMSSVWDFLWSFCIGEASLNTLCRWWVCVCGCARARETESMCLTVLLSIFGSAASRWAGQESFIWTVWEENRRYSGPQHVCGSTHSRTERFCWSWTFRLFLFLKGKTAEIKVWVCGSLKPRFQLFLQWRRNLTPNHFRNRQVFRWVSVITAAFFFFFV